MTCEIEGCEKPIVALGQWCSMHYTRYVRHGDPTVVKRRGGIPQGPKPCSVSDCAKPRANRSSLCPMHLARKRRTGTTAPGPNAQARPDERFWRHVSKGDPDECWEWTGARHRFGYGNAYGFRAHRMSYEIHNGPIPAGLLVRHTCDNPPCCNPAHLLLGTKKDNSDDCISRGRAAWPKGK